MRQRPSSSGPTRSLLVLILMLGLLVACGPGATGPVRSSDPLPTGLVGPVAPTVGPQALRYVAMGDSYTFGDGVRQRERWPNQLVRILRPALDLDLVVNLAGRSIASRDVLDEQVPELAELEPRFVSIQVGANDVCFSTPTAYADNMGRILDATLEVVPADRVVVLTTPDFTLMPVQLSCPGEPEQQVERIRELNRILTQVAEARGVAVIDISPIADLVADDPGLVASDGSHPSAKQYGAWADLAALTIRRLFQDPAPSEVASPA